ncbi:MAG: hypothetical protein IJS45_06475 [Clostridia bacterium]|nr:hypothetical protein [Clostridia bacterium]
MELENVKNEIFEALKLHSAEDAATRCLTGNFLVNTKYLTYFALFAGTVKKETLNIVYINERGIVKGKIFLKGYEVGEALKKPGVFRIVGSKCGAKRAVVCLSAARKLSIKNAADSAEKIRNALGKVELYDFVLINNGEMYSFRDEFVVRKMDRGEDGDR